MDLTPSWPKAVLFDLDGTLIDSAGDLQASVNLLIAGDGLPPLELSAVKGMIGHGLRKLAERAYAASGRPIEGAELDARYETLFDIYGRHLTVHTTLLPGAKQVLERLHEAETPCALVTNKPQRATETILDHFGIRGLFGVVLGGDAGFRPKPAPDMLLAAAAALGAPAQQSFFVGDSGADAEASRAAAMRLILVEGGYSSVPAATLGAERVIASLFDLEHAIDELRRLETAGGA